MSGLFLAVFNRSIAAGWVVLAVLLLRALLCRAPRWTRGALWAVVATRLVLPGSVKSGVSLIPSAETVSPGIMLDRTPGIHSGVPALDRLVDPVIRGAFTPSPVSSANPLQVWIPVLSAVWAAGVAGMLLYAVLHALGVRRRLSTAVMLQEGVYQSEAVASPFVFGLIRPKIYLPFKMEERDVASILAHERAHIRRGDHWWKPLGFLLLAVYWFAPLLWLAYGVFCRDVELACDERVIRALDRAGRADYAQALLNSGAGHPKGAAGPLAFGEVGIQARVRSVLGYEKPTRWAAATAVALAVVAGVCFLTDPKQTQISPALERFLNQQIAAHSRSAQTGDNAVAIDVRVLDTDVSPGKTTLYLWVLYEEYSLEDGALQLEAGAHIPTVITVVPDGAGYALAEYWEPRDGSYYAPDIRAKFPWRLWGEAMDSQRYIGAQKAACLAQARAQLGLPQAGSASGS